MSERIPVSTVLLTKNSAQTLPAYFESMKDIDDIIVLDGQSTDGTRDIVTQWPNARLFDQDPRYIDDKGYITDFSALRNSGYALAKHRWILCVDSDEQATDQLLAEIRRVVKEGTPGVYYVKRHFFYKGRRVKMAPWIEADHIRFFHLDCVRGCLRPVHERLDIVAGSPILSIDAPVDLPVVPEESLRPKYDRYLAIEVKANQNQTFSQWFRWIFIRNILAILPRIPVFVALRLMPGPGVCLPFAYDWEQMRYSWLLIWKTAPFLRSAHALSR